MKFRLFRRFVNFACGAYLLLMLFYVLIRLVIQDRYWLVSLINSFAVLLFLPLPVLLLLAGMVRSRWALLALLPIMLLMVGWFGPRFLPKPTTVSDAPVLRVMTNNMWQGNASPELVTAFIQTNQPDVIFLQEVIPARHEAALSTLESAYPYQTSLLDEVRLEHYAAVNLTLSRQPFVETEQVNIDLPEMPFIYRHVVEVEGQHVALYNVHLVAPVSGARVGGSSNYFVQVILGFDDQQRNQQIDGLLAYLETEPYPYIVAGDFNTSDLSMTYARVAGQMHDSIAQAGAGWGGSWPLVEALGWPGMIPPFIRMDYVWYSDGLRAVKAWEGTYTGSDHLPIVAEFIVEG